MDPVFAAYQAGLAVSTVVSGVAAVIAWRNRDERGARPLAVLLVAATVWPGSILLRTFVPGTQLAVFTRKLVMQSVLVLAPSLLLFALEYSYRDRYVRPVTYALLAVEPVVVTALIWTNSAHGLVWRVLEPGGETAYGLVVDYGPVFELHMLYSYLVIAVSVVLIVVYAVRSRYLYQRQIAAIVVATLVPWGANVVSLQLSPVYDLTAPAFAVSGVAFTWAVVREGFLDISPVATEVVLDEIETAVFVVDAADRLVDINDHARDLLGLGNEAVIGENARSLLSGLPSAKAMYSEVTSVRSATTREFETEDRYYRVQVTPLFERTQELVGHVFLVVDLTEQRRRQHELKQRNEQLDRFAGVVSHDLRNPLQVAQGNLALARRTGETEYFDAVERSHDRMERLLEDLLTLARQDDDLETERVAVGEIAERAWSHVDTADAALAVETDGLTVEADPDRLSQFFENLFRNAVEHGGEGVTVSVESLPDEEGFTVVDDGPGFDDADVDSVFDDGYTTSRNGTGFGLSIVAEVADQHGWAVAAADAADAGARIEVTTGEKTVMVN